MEENKTNKTKNASSKKSTTTKKSSVNKSKTTSKKTSEVKKSKNTTKVKPKTELISKEEIKKEVDIISNKVDEITKNATDGLEKLDKKINTMENVNINVTVPKDKKDINNFLLTLVCFILLNSKWITFSVNVNGYTSSSDITILHSDMFSISFLLGISKIFAILSILIFITLFINTFIKLDNHISSLKKYNLDKNLPIYFNLCYLISLFFTLLGVLYFRKANLTVGYLITLVLFIICNFVLYKQNNKDGDKNA